MKQIAAEKYPVSADESLFCRKIFPVLKKTGNLPHSIQITMRFPVNQSQNGIKHAEFRKIPCYFPCSQGILPPQIRARCDRMEAS